MKVIIVGGGKEGVYLATLLLENKQQVTLLEDNPEYLYAAKLELPERVIINGNGTDVSVLEKAGIGSADVLAAVSDTDEKNLVISTLAKMEFGVPKVIAKVNNPRNVWLYNSGMGVDVAVNPADLLSHLIVEEMNLDNMLTILKVNRGEYSIVLLNVQASAKAVNLLVRDLDIPQKAGLISIKRDGNVMIPKGDTQIKAGDDILVLTDELSQNHLKELFG